MTFVEPEGATPLDPDELAGLKFKHITTRGQLDELEQANIMQGLQWLDKRKSKTQGSEAFFSSRKGGDKPKKGPRNGGKNHMKNPCCSSQDSHS